MGEKNYHGFDRPTKGDYMRWKPYFVPEEGTIDKLENDGPWLPTSICSIVMNTTVQTIRELYITQKIRVMKFDKGPLLIRLNDLKHFKKK